MNSSPDTLSVVICAYTEDRWADLQLAVTSVQRQEPPAHEIVLVTDYNDALFERAQRELDGVRVVANAEAQGLSGARNTGISSSTGAIVAFLDDDAAAEPGWIAHLLAPYANPLVLGVGGRVVPRWDEARPSWLPPEFDWVVGCTYAGHRSDAGPIRNLIGANMSVRRDVVTEIGGFRHALGRTANLPAGCEETEFFIRATQHFPEGVVWYEPEAVVTHRVPAARATKRYFRTRCFAEGISKTQISRLVGSRDGLESERAYTTRRLPRAVLRELRNGAFKLDASGVARAATVVTGVATTAGGYGAARVPGGQRWLPSRTGEPGSTSKQRSKSRSKQTIGAPFTPALVTQIDIAHGPRPLPALDPVTGRTYERAVVLVRRDGSPIGVLELTLGVRGLSSDEYAAEIERALGVTITPAPQLDPPSTNGNGHAANPVVRERPGVAVVIATRDRVESLARCLESVRRLDHAAAQIIVVDNASPGRATAELVERLAAQDPRFIYVREERPGLARAHNCGLKLVTAPLVAFTDDDVLVDPAWLDRIIDAFDRGANIGCVTGMIFPLELETEAQDWLERYAGFNKGFEPVLFDDDRRSIDPLYPYTAGAFGSGANMAFRTDALRDMRGFDPALGAGTEAKGGDDLAVFFDMIAAGHAIAYQPGAIVYHQHHRTFEALRNQTFGYGAGLTAYLTKTILDDPSRILDMAKRAPRAVHHALSPKSAKNERLPVTTPAILVRRERKGMLVGPFLYLLSRWDTRLDERPGAASTVIVLEESTAATAATEEIVIDLVEVELREAGGATR
jgi:glycosyltransferase involved in cell wall biosynthesis